MLDAKYALLVSTEEIPAEIKRLSNKIYPLLFSSGRERLTLVHFDEEKDDLVEWFENNPFPIRTPQKFIRVNKTATFRPIPKNSLFKE